MRMQEVIAMTMGDRVKAARLKKGYTQEELAQKLGYKSRSSVNKIEKERDIPRSMIVKIAEILDVTPAYLMGWDERKPVKEKSNVQKMPTEFIRLVPVFESVSAGFGIGAVNSDKEYIPLFSRATTNMSIRSVCVSAVIPCTPRFRTVIWFRL